jgi:hypothetical protein
VDPVWSVLEEAGVPEGPLRATPTTPFASERVREALSRVAMSLDSLEARRAEALRAWLCAFRHHWPSAFDAMLGPEAESLERRLLPLAADPGRHLKLRRIAIANLAGVL